MTNGSGAIEERLKTLEERLRQQVQQRDQTRAALEQMEVACHQLHGAVSVLRELMVPPQDAASGLRHQGHGAEQHDA